MKKWKFRADLSIESQTKVKQVKAKQLLTGNDMTQAETVEFIIKNFKA